jgi:hypothetical protein
MSEAINNYDIMKLVYYSLQYNNEDFLYTYKSFIDDVLDDNPEIFIKLIDIITKLLFSGEASITKKK